MIEGNYVVESIENGLVKLLFCTDENIEEIISKEKFPYSIKQGDILKMKIVNGKLISMPLESETEKKRKQTQSLMGKLFNKNK
jgi:hypothetical protein